MPLRTPYKGGRCRPPGSPFRLTLEPLEDRSLPSVYAVTDLGTLGGTYSYATAVNRFGEVVGFSYMPGDQTTHAFSWQNGVMTDLGTLGGAQSFAYGVNDAGQIVGAAYRTDGTFHATLWDHGAVTDLGTLGGSYSQAYAINNHGQVVGYANLPNDDPPHAFLWDRGVMIDLGKLTGDVSAAYGINDAGQSAGYGDTIPGTFSPHAIRWEGAVLHDLGTFPGGVGSTGLGINSYGEVIGKAKIGAANQPHHAFLWDGVMHDLGGLDGSRGAAAQGVNSYSQVVGTSTILFTAHAFLDFNGRMFDLNDVVPKSESGWFLSVADAVNDGGQIVGSGFGPNGQHAFLLNPVNPGAIAVLEITGAIAPVGAGTAYAFTVTAKDQYGNTIPGYAGTVSFGSSDGQATLPANYTFTAADGGSHTFTVTLKSAGSQSLSVADVSNSGLTGLRSGIVVIPGAAQAFAVTGFPSTVTAGTPGAFQVVAVDAYGNTATGYVGTVAFGSTDAKAQLPGTYTFTAADGGVHTFSATLKTSREQALTVADVNQPGTAGIQPEIMVLPAAAHALVVTGFPSPTVAGAAGSFQVRVVDAFGNAVHDYNGTVTFSSSDPAAKLPAPYTFALSDSGTHGFSAMLWTAGTQWLGAADSSDAGLGGTQTGIVVVPPRGTDLVRRGSKSPAALTSSRLSPVAGDRRPSPDAPTTNQTRPAASRLVRPPAHLGVRPDAESAALANPASS
jgi:probable HAF family extracellular repeat protein